VREILEQRIKDEEARATGYEQDVRKAEENSGEK
jgi:hypothetical protein